MAGLKKAQSPILRKKTQYTEKDAIEEVHRKYGNLDSLVFYIYNHHPQALDKATSLEKGAKLLNLSQKCWNFLLLHSSDFQKLLFRPMVARQWDQFRHVRVVSDISVGNFREVRPKDIIEAGKYLREFMGEALHQPQDRVSGGIVININPPEPSNHDQEYDPFTVTVQDSFQEKRDNASDQGLQQSGLQALDPTLRQLRRQEEAANSGTPPGPEGRAGKVRRGVKESSHSFLEKSKQRTPNSETRSAPDKAAASSVSKQGTSLPKAGSLPPEAARRFYRSQPQRGSTPVDEQPKTRFDDNGRDQRIGKHTPPSKFTPFELPKHNDKADEAKGRDGKDDRRPLDGGLDKDIFG